MTKTTQLIILFFLFVFQTAAQNWSAPISGKVSNIKKEPLPNIKVILLENQLALDSVYTDSLGKFNFFQELKSINEYALEVDCYGINNPITIFRKANDTTSLISYIIEEICYTPRYEKFDNCPYYTYNSIKIFSNFEAIWFKSLLDKYPKMCIEFKQSINPAETSKVAKERMIFFKSLLNEVGCDMNRIRFLSEVIKLNESQISIDKRSRIQGVITSMDGNCR